MDIEKNLHIEYKTLQKYINKANKMYRIGQPIIDDNEYDNIIARLESLSSVLNTKYRRPLDQIQTNRGKVKHNMPMLSIEHGFHTAAIDHFVNKINNICNPFPLIAEHKIDGVAVSIIYQNGKLHELRTRGNGYIGNQINDRIPLIDIPQILLSSYAAYNIEVRGEVFMTHDTFKTVSTVFASPRNATAAILQSMQSQANIMLNFVPYNIIILDSIDSNVDSQNTDFDLNLQQNAYHAPMQAVSQYIDKIDLLTKLGFQTQSYTVCNAIEECYHYYHHITQSKDSLPYCIDGVVFKVNDLLLCQSIGYTHNAPRYIFAVKFTNPTFSTKITNIQFQVGKHGIITPVAEFEQVIINGITIQKASMHNYTEYINKQYGIGDQINIARSGDAVPYIVEKTYHANTSIPVQKCPSCSSPLHQYNQSLKCNNGWQCPQQQLLRILHFVSRDALNVTMLGESNIQMLIEQEIIQYPSDILSIPERFLSGEIIELPRFKNKSISKLLNSIMNVHKCDLSRLIYGLCIPNVGKGNAINIAKHYESLDNFLHNFNHEEKIHNIGLDTASDISKFLQNEHWIYMIPIFLNQLKSYNIEI